MPTFCRTDWNHRSVIKVGRNFGQERQQGIPLFQQIGFVDHQNDRPILGQQADNRFVLGIVTSRFNDKKYKVDIVQGLGNTAVHCPVQCIGELGLKTRRINKDKLGIGLGQNAGDPVPRGLRLAGNDADFFPNQLVEQCRLSDIGTTNNSNIAGADFGHGFRAFMAASAAFCSAIRRLLPEPMVRTAG